MWCILLPTFQPSSSPRILYHFYKFSTHLTAVYLFMNTVWARIHLRGRKCSCCYFFCIWVTSLDASLYVELCNLPQWLALTVNLTQLRITWKEGLSEDLSTSVWPRNISVRACLNFIRAEGLSPSFSGRRILNCVRIEISKWEQANKWLACIHFSLLWTVSVTGLAV